MAERSNSASELLLQEIFSSRMRAAVLGHMLPRPHRRLSLTELSRLLDLPVSSLQHECYKLERLGIVVGKREGNTRRYAVNPGFSLNRPLTALVSAALGPQLALQGVLEGVEGVNCAFFSGDTPLSSKDHVVRLVLIGDIPLEEIDSIQERASVVLDLSGDRLETVYYRPDDWLDRLKQRSAYAIGLVSGPRLDIIGNPETLA